MGTVKRTPEPGEGQRYALTSDEDAADFWGFARDAQGLFTPPPQGDGARRVRLTGCLPRGGLRTSAGRVGTRRARAGAAWLDLLDARGGTMGSYFVGEVTVVDVRPSTGHAGDADLADLADLTVTLRCDEALPGAERVWDLIRANSLNRKGMWHELPPGGRRAWLSVALWSREYRGAGRPDAPAGRVFTLDGRHIDDGDSFYCALGEAVNGPGGYFGWNLDALDDCLRGGWGATPPFTVHWENSAVARARLTERVPVAAGEGSMFDLLLDIFRERGVSVLLR